jgi:hypothetical protein
MVKVAHVEKIARLPVWPVWMGVLLFLVVSRTLGDPAAAALEEALEDTYGGRVCPNFFPTSASSSSDPTATTTPTTTIINTLPFLMLVHHWHSFSPLDPIRWFRKTFILPEGFPAHAHRGFRPFWKNHLRTFNKSFVRVRVRGLYWVLESVELRQLYLCIYVYMYLRPYRTQIEKPIFPIVAFLSMVYTFLETEPQGTNGDHVVMLVPLNRQSCYCDCLAGFQSSFLVHQYQNSNGSGIVPFPRVCRRACG